MDKKQERERSRYISYHKKIINLSFNGLNVLSKVMQRLKYMVIHGKGTVAIKIIIVNKELLHCSLTTTIKQEQEAANQYNTQIKKRFKIK